ncbi:MAG: NfeD family protein, partial [Synechocystis sp.]|nr:NfeD family protein [Synechocystis sp.]
MMSFVYLWIIAGSILCLVEVFVPVGFVAVMMGLSAIATAGFALLVPNFALQAVFWLGLSVVLIAVSRRFVPRRSSSLAIKDASEGEMISELLPGHSGRVLYEGNSWRAECEDPHQAIGVNEKVYIVG